MTQIKATYTITFTATSPFNEATYEEATLEEAVKLEENVEWDYVIQLLDEGSFRDEKLQVEVEVLD